MFGKEMFALQCSSVSQRKKLSVAIALLLVQAAFLDSFRQLRGR